MATKINVGAGVLDGGLLVGVNDANGIEQCIDGLARAQPGGQVGGAAACSTWNAVVKLVPPRVLEFLCSGQSARRWRRRTDNNAGAYIARLIQVHHQAKCTHGNSTFLAAACQRVGIGAAAAERARAVVVLLVHHRAWQGQGRPDGAADTDV